ncbi:hypothetical protein Aph01nite_44050 [Acrocarpospora phusangensis]|uniref:PPM-type phosphatase domain-containing protein n=1 Tax=Acrocarpospora phusangensis TaxID=1070424 RepID=A0A919QGL3_9ACTN|nr:SpoIIE family protein phosphatase [Acrocarpospora phusangensis]GIH26095.1 hypothetical protein Aph01nite_44050 [Acrocarpospora phusangensis]
MIRFATATRQGTEANNADAAAVHRMPETEIVSAAIVDGIGHDEGTPEWAHVAAEVAARVGARRTATVGLLTAATLNNASPGRSIRPDGVAVLAVAEPGRPTAIAWTGDAGAYGWNGEELQLLTTPQTIGEYLRYNGGEHIELLAQQHDNWIRTTLGRSTPATVHPAETGDELVILFSDGIERAPQELLIRLIREHEGDPQALADAIVAAVETDERGYRDDATVVIFQVAGG